MQKADGAPLTAQWLAGQLLRLPGAAHYHLALSGGADSVALLILFARLGSQQALSYSAIHINHQLQPDANQWADFCRTLCERLGVTFTEIRVTVPNGPGFSPEQAARDARYAALLSHLQPDQALVTGHHANDQAETLLLNLMRSSGAEGLAAMPASRPIGQGLLLRPLLSVSRAEIVAFLQQQQQTWIEDGSNSDTRYDRNFLRHRVLPVLQQRWPHAVQAISHSARLQVELRENQQALAAADWRECRDDKSGGLRLSRLQRLNAPRQRSLLRFWLGRLRPGLRMSRQQADTLLDELVAAAEDARPILTLGGNCCLRRHAGILLLSAEPAAVGNFPLAERWSLEHDYSCQQRGWQLSRLAVLLRYPQLVGDSLEVRSRQGGERWRGAPGQPSRPLKKCLQEWGVAPWMRDRLPLLYWRDELLIVWGYGAAIHPRLSRPNDTDD